MDAETDQFRMIKECSSLCTLVPAQSEDSKISIIRVYIYIQYIHTYMHVCIYNYIYMGFLEWGVPQNGKSYYEN